MAESKSDVLKEAAKIIEESAAQLEREHLDPTTNEIPAAKLHKINRQARVAEKLRHWAKHSWRTK